MIFKNIQRLLIFLLISFGFQLHLSAQQVLQTSTFGSGGAVSYNPNLRLDCTLGQLGGRISANANYILYSGFWYPADIITVVEEGQGDLPVEYSLYQNYPNPFNPSTTIKYQIPKEGLVTLKIYDILGREVRTLVNEFENTGRYRVEFNSTALSSGVYIYRLIAGDYISTKKMLLLK